MQVTYSEKARQWREGLPLLEQATRRLEEEVLGPAAAHVKAEWDRIEDDKGQPLTTLHISDPSADASAVLTLDELQYPPHLGYRLHRLWGDILQVKSHKQLEKLKGMNGSEN